MEWISLLFWRARRWSVCDNYFTLSGRDLVRLHSWEHDVETFKHGNSLKCIAFIKKLAEAFPADEALIQEPLFTIHDRWKLEQLNIIRTVSMLLYKLEITEKTSFNDKLSHVRMPSLHWTLELKADIRSDGYLSQKVFHRLWFSD